MGARKPVTLRNDPHGVFALPEVTVAVDLGARKVGVAMFSSSHELVAAATVRVPAGNVWVPAMTARAVEQWVIKNLQEVLPARWVCEWPQKYDNFRVAHDDIESLWAVGQQLSPWTATYTPHQWKGNVPKSVHQRRIFVVLTQYERAVAAGLDHDAVDAIGIGLFALGRMSRAGRG